MINLIPGILTGIFFQKKTISKILKENLRVKLLDFTDYRINKTLKKKELYKKLDREFKWQKTVN